ncbi:hypothetical protein ACFOD1_04755 [Pseudidiomarina halophila]|uniref:Uncharacterized protein n=1 Tax=Pseudidiomarina halophila TaxID=1449799 RepID=A0A432XZX2_9GAMM|nr:hypothetical protein [Pseudidiomarina halophila]RUO54241.1 hypothetical protein CWI69_02115 [Pseudidiomarina halophila]
MPETNFHSLSAADWSLNVIVTLLAVAVVIILFLPKIRDSELWRATAIPLASIIGSGFLIVAPLLAFTVGAWAIVAVIAILALAFLVGKAVRYNIKFSEPLTETDQQTTYKALTWAGELAKLVLAFAYIIAITFYLELLGAFSLRLVGYENPVAQKTIATLLLIFIGLFGWLRGLRLLEALEESSVNVKLAIISAFILGLAFFNAEQALSGDWQVPQLDPDFNLETVRILLGSFLIVQGFETSRYLRGDYPAHLRIKTMRYGQLIAAAIYVCFIALATTLFDEFETISETGVIDLSAEIAFVLPWLLIIAAVMSQFSAAVADMIGSGGLVEEASDKSISKHTAYLTVAILAIGLLWSTDIFSIIAYASRAFALYYALQCLIAAVHAISSIGNERHIARGIGFGLLVVAMLAIAFFAIPVTSAGHSIGH